LFHILVTCVHRFLVLIAFIQRLAIE